MKIKPEILACLIKMAKADIAKGYMYSPESFAVTLSKYIEQYTEGKKLKVPIEWRTGDKKKFELYTYYISKIKSYE